MSRLFKNHLLGKSYSEEGETVLEGLRHTHTDTHAHRHTQTHTDTHAHRHTQTHTHSDMPVLGYWHWRLRGSFLADIEADVNLLWWDISISFTLLHSKHTTKCSEKKGGRQKQNYSIWYIWKWDKIIYRELRGQTYSKRSVYLFVCRSSYWLNAPTI